MDKLSVEEQFEGGQGVSIKQIFIDFNSGFAGGILNVLSGHPLE